jgi:hypothetical protein
MEDAPSAGNSESERGLEETLLSLSGVQRALLETQERREQLIRDARLRGATWLQIAESLDEKRDTVYQRWAHRMP